MPFSFNEKPNSRKLSQEPPSLTIPFVARGEFDEDVVMSYALGNTPLQTSSQFGQLYRTDIQVTNAGHLLYDVDVVYGKRKNEVGSWRLTFDGSGGTRNQQFSYKTTRYPDTIPDNGGLIGVDPITREVKGIDVIEPSCKVNVHFTFAEGVFDQSFINLVSRQSGKMNSRRFLGWRPGEVQFVAPAGSEGSDVQTEVNFQLMIMENLVNVTIAGITGINKRGWDVIEPFFKVQADGAKLENKPSGFYVHQVCREADFGSILGFGG